MTKHRQTATPPGDPDTTAWLRSAQRNRAARTPKQQADAERIRVRVDLPPEIKDALAWAAKASYTSASQLAAFLLARELILFYSNDTDLDEALDAASKPARSINHMVDLDLGPLTELLTDLAEAVIGAE